MCSIRRVSGLTVGGVTDRCVVEGIGSPRLGLRDHDGTGTTQTSHDDGIGGGSSIILVVSPTHGKPTTSIQSFTVIGLPVADQRVTFAPDRSSGDER